MYAQQIEEMDFFPMSMADEARFQHGQGMACSFDCAACDPFIEEDFEVSDEDVAKAEAYLASIKTEAVIPWSNDPKWAGWEDVPF